MPLCISFDQESGPSILRQHYVSVVSEKERLKSTQGFNSLLIAFWKLTYDYRSASLPLLSITRFPFSHLSVMTPRPSSGGASAPLG